MNENEDVEIELYEVEKEDEANDINLETFEYNEVVVEEDLEAVAEPKPESEGTEPEVDEGEETVGYVGSFVDGKKSGFGNERYFNGSIYKGGWANDQYHGRGIKKFAHYADESIFEGEHFEHKRQGKGKMVYKENSSYEGDWKNDFYDGQGVYCRESSTVFEGSWSNG